MDILLNRVKKGELIHGLADRELTNPEGAGFDLRVSSLYRIRSSGLLHIDIRNTSEIELLGEYDELNPIKVTLTPGQYYLAKLVESVALDYDMIGILHPRSTLFRSGIVLQTGVCPPGYSGQLIVGMHVASPFNFELQLGSRIAHINILRIEGKSSPYRGQWQGGRVTTNGSEEQK